jgi:hypothetical protein
VTIIIVAIAWSMATLLTNAMNACAMVYAQTTGFIAVLVRGYAPQTKEEDKDAEDKPLAG